MVDAAGGGRAGGSRPLEDYALLGDGQSAALVSRAGSVDWLCWPRFDSPPLFAALLDAHQGGECRVAPTVGFRAERRYAGESAVLETRFHAPHGTLLLTDALVLPEAFRGQPAPQAELLRVARCEAGAVPFEVVVRPRRGWHQGPARLADAGPLGLRLAWGAHLLTARASLPLTLAPGGSAHARGVLRAGERLVLSLTYDDDAPATLPPLGEAAERRLAATRAAWETWAKRARYDGPHRAEVVRSALALKLLTFAPSGALVAAPTTSLPERVGGALNWDYRFSWLRDAALTTRALFGLGYAEEAHAWVSWLTHATRLTQPELRVLYDVYGRTPPPEAELEHLAGWRGSRPVRVGNAAMDQVQLDVYGEVIDAVTQLYEHAEAPPDRETVRMLRAFGEWVCHSWERPDAGPWEVRTAGQHFTSSKVLAWVALDRLVRLHERGWARKLPVDTFRENRELLRQRIEQRGWNPARGAYVQELDGHALDASVLMAPLLGYAPPDAPRVRSTVRTLERVLSPAPGLLYRNEQSLEIGEGAFVVCGFWLVEALARGAGPLAHAEAHFRAACAYVNDLGLLAEEVDVASGRAIGNFPQAFSHVGLVSAALALEEARARRGARVAAEEVPA